MTVYYPVKPTSTRDASRDRLLALANLSSADAVHFFDDFDSYLDSAAFTPAGWRDGKLDANSGAAIVVRGGGASQIFSGTTASKIGGHYQPGISLSTQGTTKWGFECRFAIDTAVDSQAMAIMGWKNAAANKTIFAGFIGALSSTNFIVQYDGNYGGSYLDMGVAVDTAWHTIRVWCDGANRISARLDSGSVVSATMSSAASDGSYVDHEVRNGTTAANRALSRDYWCHVVARP